MNINYLSSIRFGITIPLSRKGAYLTNLLISLITVLKSHLLKYFLPLRNLKIFEYFISK